MKDILLTSSALILALLALRRVFRKTLSRRVQYALWGLVLLRLLVPVSLPAAEFSLLTAAEPARQAVEAQLEAPRRYFFPTSTVPASRFPAADMAEPGHEVPDYAGSFDYPVLSEDGTTVDTYAVRLETPFVWKHALTALWALGMGVMAAWLLLSNLLFWRKLRKARTPYPVENSGLPVYLVGSGLPSPCLFGLFRPAVYLTPAAAASPDSLRHVLAHEETHARHLDPLWSLLRGLCLVVYWFDPLVWWAALASRTDCELACDEGALRRLGEAERVPYGRTLLSLIPVRKAPANPLLSATTMTSDKKRLKDRLTRIAENRRNLGTALFAVISLAALVCAVTFTGAKTQEPLRPLTEEELDYFNGEFFTEAYTQGENRRRQFLTSVYDRPENIDLYELLYNGTGFPSELTEEDWQLLEEFFPNARETGCVKITQAHLDAFLRENTGLTSEQCTNGLDRFWWALAADAYYNVYPASAFSIPYSSFYDPRRLPEPVTFTSGQREGDVVRLWYQGSFYESETYTTLRRGPLCLTLREKPGGGWLFVSNEWALTDQAPASPDWDPLFTVPLDGLEPYEPEVMEPIPYPYDYREMLDSPEDPDHILGDYCLMFFGNEHEVFAGVQHKARSSFPQPFWSFRTGTDGHYSVSWFRNLMGHDGFCISCNYASSSQPAWNEYFYLNEDGRPVRLARLQGWPETMDLDGDGQKELVSQESFRASFCFQRDGQYYQADLDTLLKDHWPDVTAFYYEHWNAAGRGLPFQAHTYPSLSLASPNPRQYRMLYFDGESLLVYNDQRHFSDHMTEWFDVYAEVKDAALDVVQTAFTQANLFGQTLYDDWRITGLEGARVLELDEVTYYLWQVYYEFHAPQPQETPQGGVDAWLDPFYPEQTWLVFRDGTPEDESRLSPEFFFSFRRDDFPTAEQLREELSKAMSEKTVVLENAILHAPASMAGEAAQAALERILEGGTVSLTLLSEGGRRCDADPETIDSELRERFTGDYKWSYAEEAPGDMPAESLLMIGGGMSLRFWPDSDLVLLHQFGQDTWFRAEPAPPGTVRVFYLARTWYTAAAGRSLPVQGILEDILRSGGTFTLTTPEGAETRPADPARLSRISAFTGDYTWDFVWDTYVRSPITLELASQDGRQSFTFSPQNLLVKLRQGETDFWFTARPDTDSSYIYDFVYAWYEESAPQP